MFHDVLTNASIKGVVYLNKNNIKIKIMKIKELDSKKLILMAKVIINAIKKAKMDTNIDLKTIDWQDLEEEWFDWLHDELIGADEPLV